jgi:acyl-CoA synthetase (AMP-forming)/AMP-acid ligase II
MFYKGIKAGDRVAIAMRNRPEWVVAFIAAARLGAVPAPLNSFGLGEELRAALDDLQADVLVCDTDRLQRIDPAYLSTSMPVVLVGPALEQAGAPALGYDEVIARPVGELPEVTPAPDDPALILFTSGATSRAKAVVSSQRAVCQALFNIDYISAMSAMTSPEALARIQKMARAPVILTAVPLFHVSGLHAQLLTAVRTGRRLVFMHKWEPKAAIELMRTEQVTQFNGAPSMVMQLLREADFHTEAVKGGLAGLGFGGAGLPQGLIDEVLDALPDQLVGIGYGMTETNGVGSAISGDLFRLQPTASGLTSPLMEVKVMSPDGRDQPKDQDGEICLRCIMGAGLTAETWQRWVDRFGEMDIYEGWGSTEANTNLINVDNHIGSCGRVPDWNKTNFRLIRYDLENDVHLRDENGFCILCEPNEVGEGVGMIINHPEIGGGRFEGYTSRDATEQKILRDVFSEGDSWWRSGDLLRFDEDGYFYFVDRVGDTFRWKSENVSTQEVASALGDFKGAELINIYGVQVPQHEGRAGMAAIVMQEGESFDPQAFYDLTVERVPNYAAPLFVRVSAAADMTTTFKLRKVDLQRQGYAPEHCADPLYVRDDRAGTYRPYSTDVLAEVGLPPFEYQ